MGKKRMKITKDGVDGPPPAVPDEQENREPSGDLEIPVSVPLAVKEVLEKTKKPKKKEDAPE